MVITHIKVNHLITCAPKMMFSNRPSDDIINMAVGYSIGIEVYKDLDTRYRMEFELHV